MSDPVDDDSPSGPSLLQRLTTAWDYIPKALPGYANLAPAEEKISEEKAGASPFPQYPDIELVYDKDEPNKPVILKEDGFEFYLATKLSSQRKREDIKIAILNVKPSPTPSAKSIFRDQHLLNPYMRNYQFVGQKIGGTRNIDKEGGRHRLWYVLKDPGDVNNINVPTKLRSEIILFKQDASFTQSLVHKLMSVSGLPSANPDIVGKKIVHNGKNIAEYLASCLMSLMAGDTAATVFFATPSPEDPHKVLPDKLGNKVFIGSVYFDEAQDLWRDVKRINGQTPKPGESRPRFVGSNPWRQKAFRNAIIDSTTGQPRFHNLQRLAALSAWLGDFDFHAANLMVLAPRNRNNPDDPDDFKRDAEGNIIPDELGKLGKIVRIDLAWALKDLTDEIHLFSAARHFFLTSKGTQPTNHFLEFSRELFICPAYAEELDLIASFNPEAILQTITSSFDEIGKFYGALPIAEYAKEHMGMDLKKYLTASEYSAYKTLKTKLQELEKTQDQIAINNLDDSAIKDRIIAITKDYLSNQLKNRQASARRLALQIKASLCLDKQPDGTFAINYNAPYNFAELIQEDPEYFFNRDFHFRKEDQNTMRFLYWKFTNSNVKPAAMQGTIEGAYIILRKALGSRIKRGDNFLVDYYTDKDAKEVNLRVPTGVRQFVLSEKDFANNLPIKYNKQKKLSPTLSTTVKEGQSLLMPGQFALNIPHSDTQGLKGLYIEQVTKNNTYKITTHRLPPEINPRYIFSAVIREHCNKDLFSTDPSLWKDIKRICAKLSVDVKGKLDSSLLKADEIQFLNLITRHSHSKENLLPGLHSEFIAAHKSATRTLDPSTGYDIPSKVYLEFARQQCESLLLANPDAIINLLPDSKTKTHAKDPLLVEAYIIVCEMNNWVYKNKSGWEFPHYENNAPALASAVQFAKTLLPLSDIHLRKAPAPRH